MELFYELLLTAAVTLLAAFLLATLVAANDPSRRESGTDRAAAIAEEVAEEERIIEVDEVKLREGRAAAAQVEAEGWVEAEKAPAVVVEEDPECLVEEEDPECLVEEEGIPVKAALRARVGSGVEEEKEEEGDVGEKRRRDLAAAADATGVVVEANPHALAAEAVPREVLDVVGLEKGGSRDVVVKQRDLRAEVAPIEVLDTRPEKQSVQVVEVAEVLPSKTEAVEVKQHHLVAEVAPAAKVLDAVLEEKSVQAIEVRPDELAAEAASQEVLDVVSEKKEEQVVELKDHELAVEAAPRPVLDVPLAEKEDLQGQQPVEEAVDVREEAQSKEVHADDQPEEVVPEEELVAWKTDNVEVTQAGSSNDKHVTELPVEEVTLQGLTEDDAQSDMDLEEWEGIERSEMEKRFGAAAAFAASEAGAAALSKLDSDVQLQLQGLLKVAIDGPCYESAQPLTLRPSSRAKWVAWQKLGNMHHEIAMEKYMNLLSETIPGWLGHETLDTKKHEAGCYSEGPILAMNVLTDQQSNQGNEDSSSIDEGRLATSPNPEKGQSSDIPAE